MILKITCIWRWYWRMILVATSECFGNPDTDFSFRPTRSNPLGPEGEAAHGG